ncbi:13641_t:CDS:2, partial [Ambispora leptoticha]
NSNDTYLLKSLFILDPKPSAGSLSIYDISNNEMIDFISILRSIEEGIGTGTGSDLFSGTFLISKKINIYISQEFVKLLNEYYNNVYETNIFVHSVDLASDSSTFSKRYENSSRILAKFSDSNDVTIYSDQIQFFFEHSIDYPEASTKHNLVYIHWYKKVKDEKLRYHLNISKNNDKLYNVEL